ncbi:hypothetical protein [Streptomyces sp. NPDC046821]|uniref:hypothetical protein n=1 Tax=Streptomyces sp. NPDC046821 TaxID=3154702 RepID=UPI0033E9794C
MVTWGRDGTSNSAVRSSWSGTIRNARQSRDAPEFNPVEGIWSHLKRSLANLTKHSLDQLTALVKTRLKRMQYRPGLIDGLIAKAGLDFQPP